MDNVHPTSKAAPSAAGERKRRLRTLAVCDLVESTALVERLGDIKAAELIQRHDTLARTLLEAHHGQEIDKTDGFLVLFERPGQAVGFALAYHLALATLATSSGTPLQARVGINMGDVVMWDNAADAIARGAKPVEVEGIAKPIAARLAQLALPGQTLLPGSTASMARRAQDEMQVDPATLRWRRHGRYRLKGLPDPVSVVEVGLVGHAPLRAPGNSRTGVRIGFPWRTPAAAVCVLVIVGVVAGVWLHRRGAGASAKSIAVLPFVNLGGNPAQQYFSDGITEELTDALGKDTGLSVTAWETASQFAGGKATPQQLGKALGVAHILGGTIQREGSQVRVTAELVNTATGKQVWSNHYDGSLTNIFGVEDQISAAIASALKARFAGPQAAPTSNPKAHDLYLKGLLASSAFTAQSVPTAQRYFAQALQLDPDYADAWAALAVNYHELVQVSTFPPGAAVPKIRAAAHKALALDPRNAQALVALGLADISDNQVDAAKARFRQALAIDPSNVSAHVAYGNLLPLDAALVQEQAAARLNPDSIIALNNVAAIYQDLSEWPQLVRTALALNKLAPHYTDTAFGLAFAYSAMRRGQDAVRAFDLVKPRTPLATRLVAAGRLTYQALLDPALRPQALAALERLRSGKINPHAMNAMAQLYAALGERDAAQQMLAKVCAAVPEGCADLAINPMWKPLRGDPRFKQLAKQYTTVTLATAPASH